MTLAQADQILDRGGGGFVPPPPRAVVHQKSPDQTGLKWSYLFVLADKLREVL